MPPNQIPSLQQPPFKIGTFRTHPLNQIPFPPLLKPGHNPQYLNIKSKTGIGIMQIGLNTFY